MELSKQNVTFVVQTEISMFVGYTCQGHDLGIRIGVNSAVQQDLGATRIIVKLVNFASKCEGS